MQRSTPLEMKAKLQQKIDEAKARLEIAEMKKQLKDLTRQNVAMRKKNGKAKKEAKQSSSE